MNRYPKLKKTTQLILLLAFCMLNTLHLKAYQHVMTADEKEAQLEKATTLQVQEQLKSPLKNDSAVLLSTGRTEYPFLGKRYTNHAYTERLEKNDIDQIEFNASHARSVYTFQHYSSIVIFIVVIFIVLTGIYLSYKQFEFTHEMLRKQQENPTSIVRATVIDTGQVEQAQPAAPADIVQQPPAITTASDTTSLEVSKDGIKINSAVIGLIILVISVAFFFLYLQFVYPIHKN